jgi:hypothetical protein
MTLREYLHAYDLTIGDLHEQLIEAGVSITYHGVGRWVRGERFPDLRTIATIEAVTRGDVTLDDWVKLDQRRKSRKLQSA